MHFVYYLLLKSVQKFDIFFIRIKLTWTDDAGQNGNTISFHGVAVIADACDESHQE